MVKWRVLVEYVEEFTGAKIIEVEAKDWEDGLKKMKEKTEFLQPDKFLNWKQTDDFKTWKKQAAYRTKNYLLNIFEDDYDGDILPKPEQNQPPPPPPAKDFRKFH